MAGNNRQGVKGNFHPLFLFITLASNPLRNPHLSMTPNAQVEH
jgi:hypothetical protein